MTTIPVVTMAWQWAGAQLGLSYDSTFGDSRHGASLTGAVDGFAVAVVEQLDGHGNPGSYHGTNTVFRIQLDQLEIGCALAMWPSRSPLRRFSPFKRHHVLVGEAQWDRAFVVRSTSSTLARQFLTPERRAAVAAANPRRLEWTFGSNELHHRCRYLLTDGELIVVRLLQLIDIAKAITKGNEAHT